jgi:hypothetical protein
LQGATFVSYNAPAYLGDRHRLSDELSARIAGIDDIAGALVAQ